MGERERALRVALSEDPNDAVAFRELVEIIDARATDSRGEGNATGREENPDRDPVVTLEEEPDSQNTIWALAEELAGYPTAWLPLLELARLSVHDDRDGALRRLSTAAERDPSGQALAEALRMLREAGLPGEAMGLGVGHWRPREHTPDAGRELVMASVESGRLGEARRHMEALAAHPDRKGVAKMRDELEKLIQGASSRN